MELSKCFIDNIYIYWSRYNKFERDEKIISPSNSGGSMSCIKSVGSTFMWEEKLVHPKYSVFFLNGVDANKRKKNEARGDSKLKFYTKKKIEQYKSTH